MQSSCQLCTKSGAFTVAVVAGGTEFDYGFNNSDLERLKKYLH